MERPGGNVVSNGLKTVKSVVIVGGGSSGWMAAAYLSHVLYDIDITLIESPSTPIIGVGEATIPFIRSFMRRIGLGDDREWMPKCDATFKTGILFENWYEKGDTYWHPLFEDLDYLDGPTHSGHCWLYLHRGNHPDFQSRQSFYEAAFSTATVNAANNRIPASREYAYHFDVHLFVELLKSAAPGVRHLSDHVLSAKLNEQGEITQLVTQMHGELTADLYIDCTGFRAHLIGQVSPGRQFQSYAGSLLCDSAVVLRMPYESEAEKRRQMHPFVKASAQTAGWVWTIPLYSRVSSGYVYSSRFCSPDEAELELRRYWGEARTANLESLRLKFETGKLDRLWVKNCIAVGLSGGFIEPLESTGLAITQLGVEMLASMLDARYYDEKMIERYNAYLEKFYRDVMQFFIAHYCFSSRQDSEFWRAATAETVIPDDLRARLDVFRRLGPSFSTKGTSEVWMFRDLSWFSVLLGMNFDFETPVVSSAALAAFNRLLPDRRMAVQDLLSRLPNHYDYLSGQGRSSLIKS